jgi:hypothetical protein
MQTKRLYIYAHYHISQQTESTSALTEAVTRARVSGKWTQQRH